MNSEPPVKRAVVFVDGQNLFHAAREAFGYTYPNYDVSALAKQVCMLLAKRSAIPTPTTTFQPSPSKFVQPRDGDWSRYAFTLGFLILMSTRITDGTPSGLASLR